MLQAKGYRTLETDTAEAGIVLARERQPGLILMDMQLPGMSGIDALSQLRTEPATQAIPVIAATPSARTHNRQQILIAGFDGYQAKPISVSELVQTVRMALHRRTSEK